MSSYQSYLQYLRIQRAHAMGSFHWHASRGMMNIRETASNPQDYTGKELEPLGLNAFKAAKCTMLGVPHDNSGQFAENRGGEHYIMRMRALYPGCKIIRTLPHLVTLFQRYFPHIVSQRGGVDLGWAVRSWYMPPYFGTFCSRIVQTTHTPIDGIGLDLEEAPWDPGKYPITPTDRAMAASGEVGRRYSLDNPDDREDFRAFQIALLYQMLTTALQARFSTAKIVVGYSGYGSDTITTGYATAFYPARTSLPLKAYHGVDWDKMLTPINWQGETLSPVTHPMLTGANRRSEPQKTKDWVRALQRRHPRVRIIFNDQHLGATKLSRRGKLESILDMARFADRIGLVKQERTWGDLDNEYMFDLREILEDISYGR